MATQTFQSAQQRFFRNFGITMIVLLAVQFIFGMINNLFVQFPDSGTAEQMYRFAGTQFTELFHVVLGLILFLAGAFLLIRAIRARHRVWIIASATGLIAITAAIYAGVMFIPTQDDPYSLAMAIAFIVTLLAYMGGLLF